MKRFLYAFFLPAFFSSIVFAQEPANLDVAKQAVIRYHDSGHYQQDVANVIQRAQLSLEKQIKQNTKHKKLAVILDIDETALSNYPSMKALNFGGTFDEITQEEDKANDPVIEPTLKLYQYAKAHQVAVFFLTGRKEFERAATSDNLKKAGYREWDGLILRPEAYYHTPAADYKALMRKNIEKQGYHIVLNIGDQKSDLKGEAAGKTFKLPNPYYYIP